MEFNLAEHLRRQQTWSSRTFGPGIRTEAVVDHIKKELLEVQLDPTDLREWVDVILLALDGAWRAGYTPEEICAALEYKQTINENRRWPDWRTADQGKGIEHIKQP